MSEDEKSGYVWESERHKDALFERGERWKARAEKAEELLHDAEIRLYAQREMTAKAEAERDRWLDAARVAREDRDHAEIERDALLAERDIAIEHGYTDLATVKTERDELLATLADLTGDAHGDDTTADLLERGRKLRNLQTERDVDAEARCKCGHKAWIDHGGVMAPPSGCDECFCTLNEEQAAAGMEPTYSSHRGDTCRHGCDLSRSECAKGCAERVPLERLQESNPARWAKADPAPIEYLEGDQS